MVIVVLVVVVMVFVMLVLIAIPVVTMVRLAMAAAGGGKHEHEGQQRRYNIPEYLGHWILLPGGPGNKMVLTGRLLSVARNAAAALIPETLR